MDFDLLKIQSHLLWGFGGGRGEYLLAWWPPVCVYSATIFGFRFPFFVPFLPPLGWMIVSFSVVRWGAVDRIFVLWCLLKFNTNISCNIFFSFFFSSFSHTHSMWKYAGQRSNPSHSCRHAGSLTRCKTAGAPLAVPFFLQAYSTASCRPSSIPFVVGPSVHAVLLAML